MKKEEAKEFSAVADYIRGLITAPLFSYPEADFARDLKRLRKANTRDEAERRLL